MNLKEFQKRYQDKLAHYAVGSIILSIAVFLAWITTHFVRSPVLVVFFLLAGVSASVYIAVWKEKKDLLFDKADMLWTILGAVITALTSIGVYLLLINTIKG